MQFTTNGKIDLALLSKWSQQPPVFEGGTVEFWHEPHIAAQMLDAHLNPHIDAASRKPHEIDQSVKWIIETLNLKPGDTLLDLGCGPGLYARRFAEQGIRVTGIDFSQNSIYYARTHDSQSTYVCQDYLTIDYEAKFDAVCLIYGDLCVLDDAKRDRLLALIRRALKPGGRFVFDVTTPKQHQAVGTSWYVEDKGGFWRPTPHMVLEQNFIYPEDDVALTQYIIIESDCALQVYRNWFHDYTLETITAVMEKNSFQVQAAHSDLMGTPYADNSHWIGVVAF